MTIALHIAYGSLLAFDFSWCGLRPCLNIPVVGILVGGTYADDEITLVSVPVGFYYKHKQQ